MQGVCVCACVCALQGGSWTELTPLLRGCITPSLALAMP